MLKFFVFLVSSLALGVLIAPRARACSAYGCTQPYARPRASALLANAGGVWLAPGRTFFDASNLEFAGVLTLTLGDTSTVLESDLLDRSVDYGVRLAVRTTDELVEGATLTLHAPSGCDVDDAGPRQNGLIRTWTITRAMPKPSSLGSLEAEVGSSASGGRIANGVGCSETIPAATAHVTLVASADAAPWVDAMVFETLVDGVAWRPDVSAISWAQYSGGEDFGGSWVARGEDIVFAGCNGEGGVALGAHTVVMRGILPDGTVVESTPVSVVLACSAEFSDAGVDAGAPRGDGGGCAAAPGGDAWSTPGLLVVAFGLVAYARRRSARRG